MPIEVKVPEVGESITEVQIAEWLKKEGDTVKKDEALVVIDSEKTTLELPAPESGTLGRILHQAGDTVPVGATIAHLEAGETAAAPAKPEATEKTDKKPAAKPSAKPAAKPEKQSEPQESKPAASLAVDPDLGSPRATSPKADESGTTAVKRPAGNKKEDDKKAERKAKAAAEARPESEEAEQGEAEEQFEGEQEDESPKPTPAAAPQATKPAKTKSAGDGEEEVVPMSMLRRTVARRLVEAKQQMAMLTSFNEVDMTAVQELRHAHQEAFEKRHQVKLGLMSFFVKAAVDALKQFPQINAEVRGNDIVYHNYFNIGVAIATGRGLVVPVLRRAERSSFADIEKAIGDFAARAKDGKLKPEELDGATFTITNGGVFGSLLSTPIINPPQSGILGMHTIQERPVALQGQVVIRPMMYLALTYDHRLVDGREAVLFLRRIKEAIESPARMLLEI